MLNLVVRKFPGRLEKVNTSSLSLYFVQSACW